MKNLAEKKDLRFLSMGMSADYKKALMLGATHVRIGTLLFGKQIDYMKICVAIINNNLESEICNFISTINKFNIFFKKIEEINDKTNELALIIANKNNQGKEINVLKKLLAYECSNFIFLIPSSLKLISKTNNNKIIYFPIDIIDFEKAISKICKQYIYKIWLL